MNSAITFSSFICLLWLTGVVLGLPAGTVPGIFKIYLLAHILFLLGGWLGNQQWSWYSTHYLRLYTVFSLPVLACAILMTLLVTTKNYEMFPLALLCVFGIVAIFFTAWLTFPHYPADPETTYLYRLLGAFVAIFISCGLVMFLSIAVDQGAIWEKIKITSGAFWFLEGAIHWVWGVWMVRGERTRATHIHEWAVPLLAVFAFFYLGWSLSQHVPETERGDAVSSVVARHPG